MCSVLLVAFTSVAQARRHTFHNKSGVGLMFRGGLAPQPENELLPTPTKSARSYTMIAGFEPMLDFGNFGLRLSVAGNLMPNMSGSGTDPVNAKVYSESSDTTVLTYGGSLVLYPYYSEEKRGRAYFGLGGGVAQLYLKNKRDYMDTAGQTTDSFTVKGRGNAPYIQGFLGYEFFIVQNYIMSFEAGYRSLSFGEVEHKSSTDVRGTDVDIGTPMRDARGNTAGVSLTGVYGMMSFAILF